MKTDVQTHFHLQTKFHPNQISQNKFGNVWPNANLEYEYFECDVFQQKYHKAIDSLRARNRELEEKMSKINKPISYTRLEEFTTNDPLNQLFVVTVSVRDLRRIINKRNKEFAIKYCDKEEKSEVEDE